MTEITHPCNTWQCQSRVVSITPPGDLVRAAPNFRTAALVCGDPVRTDFTYASLENVKVMVAATFQEPDVVAHLAAAAATVATAAAVWHRSVCGWR